MPEGISTPVRRIFEEEHVSLVTVDVGFGGTTFNIRIVSRQDGIESTTMRRNIMDPLSLQMVSFPVE